MTAFAHCGMREGGLQLKYFPTQGRFNPHIGGALGLSFSAIDTRIQQGNGEDAHDEPLGLQQASDHGGLANYPTEYSARDVNEDELRDHKHSQGSAIGGIRFTLCLVTAAATAAALFSQHISSRSV